MSVLDNLRGIYELGDSVKALSADFTHYNTKDVQVGGVRPWQAVFFEDKSKIVKKKDKGETFQEEGEVCVWLQDLVKYWQVVSY